MAIGHMQEELISFSLYQREGMKKAKTKVSLLIYSEGSPMVHGNAHTPFTIAIILQLLILMSEKEEVT